MTDKTCKDGTLPKYLEILIRSGTQMHVHILTCLLLSLSFREEKQAAKMKEENLFHRRFSLCPNATSPPTIDPRTLTRNLSYGGDNDLYNLSPGKRISRTDTFKCVPQLLLFSCFWGCCAFCLSADWFTEFIYMWLCAVGSHQAVTQTRTLSPCWVMTLVLPNHQAAR